MEMPYRPQQLEWMREFVQHRIDFLNPLFQFLNYFDTPYFFFLLVPLIWIGFSSRWGIRVFYLYTANALLNGFLKHLFGWPRPSHDLPDIGLFSFKSFGFPSGGAQISILFGGLLIYYWKNKKAAWPIGLFYILLISFSRIYLGVHYPTDILGGWIFGLIFLGLFIVCIDPIEKFLASQKLSFCLILSLVLPLLLLLPFGQYLILGSCLGAGLGIYLSLSYRLYLPVPKTLLEGILRGVIAIATLFLIFWVWPPELPPYAESFVLSFWLAFGTSPLCRFLV